MMKILILFQMFFCLIPRSNGQGPFIVNIQQPQNDGISDVVQIEDRFYFLQTRSENFVDIDPVPQYDIYSDIIVTTNDGTILRIYNLNGLENINGLGTEYQRILKVKGDDIYLVGFLKNDTCISRFVISKFNIVTQELEHLSSLDFCENKIWKIKIVSGLNGKTFIEEFHHSGPGFVHHIFEIDSTNTLKLSLDTVAFATSFSIDFSRKGYIVASSKLFKFYDADFNFRKQIFKNEETNAFEETVVPVRRNMILVETTQDRSDLPDEGIQFRLIDSSITLKKKLVFPSTQNVDYSFIPYFGGIDIKNKNEIWVTGLFETHFPYFDSSYFFITKLDSNLNISCQHFLGYDTGYNLNGIRTLSSGGAIIFGSRLRNGLSVQVGYDIYAIQLGEDCELPSTVSTNGPPETFLSISAYPNPGINDLTFSVNGFDPATLQVEMIDHLGQVLFTAKDLTNSIQVPELSAGQYFYRILQKDKLLGVGIWVKQ